MKRDKEGVHGRLNFSLQVSNIDLEDGQLSNMIVSSFCA